MLSFHTDTNTGHRYWDQVLDTLRLLYNILLRGLGKVQQWLGKPLDHVPLQLLCETFMSIY